MDKGYCERVIESDDGDSWFLPHHGVYHPQKKKIRVVFDCSARCSGFSLNDHLLHGPDLSNSIAGVLTRFRFDLIAFVADLEAMFYQVQVPQHDRRYLRFLWWEGNRWRREFIAVQQPRQKWATVRRNLAVGDVVLLKNEAAARNQWPLCLVEEVDSDERGFVRSVLIRCEGKSIRRPIHKLIFLFSLMPNLRMMIVLFLFPLPIFLIFRSHEIS
jgi:hypothetical protein